MSTFPGFDAALSEWLISDRPFVVRRRVKWGECDPAGVVYTINVSEYVNSVANRFYVFLLGAPVEQGKDSQGFAMRVKPLSVVSNRGLRQDELFDMSVTVIDVRERSFDLAIEATTLSGEHVFAAKLSPICAALSERKSIEIPPVFRARLAEVAANRAAILSNAEE
jgi:acyl-CoA thioesterase FadM